jgi:2-oxoglutarate dehydrogenase E2 component (dihydrolipoamide succinyltransferase)
MDILMPQLGETVAEGTVTNWYKQVGDAVQADEALFDVETDKVSTEIPSPIAGVLTEVLVPAGQTVKVGTRLAVVRGTGEQAAPLASRPATQAPPPMANVAIADAQAAPRADGQKLSPVVRRLLAENGLNAADIRGTGRDGRVTRDDVLQHLDQHPQAAAPAPTPTPVTQPTPAAGSGETVLQLNNIRRKTGAAMARAWRNVPHVLQAVEADYSRIEAARREKGASWQTREGYALTYLPFLAWAGFDALRPTQCANRRR